MSPASGTASQPDDVLARAEALLAEREDIVAKLRARREELTVQIRGIDVALGMIAEWQAPQARAHEKIAPRSAESVKDRALEYLQAHPTKSYNAVALARAVGGKSHSLRTQLSAMANDGLIARGERGTYRALATETIGAPAALPELSPAPPIVAESRAPLAVEPHDLPALPVKEPDEEDPGMPPGLPRSYRRVFRFLSEHDGPHTTKAIAERLGMPKHSARIALRNLKRRGFVELTGRTSGAVWHLKRAAIPAPKLVAAERPAETRNDAQPHSVVALPPEAANRVVALPVLGLRTASDMFRCEPLSVTMMARACVTRQQGARAQVGKHATCRSCPLGERVAKAVGLNPGGADLIDNRVASGTAWARPRKTGTS